MNVLELEDVSKRFGQLEVLRNVTFCVPEHTVFGFIGKNGAGKTTTMKMILGFLRPTSGRIAVCGEPVGGHGHAFNRLVGYLPDVPEFYPYLNAEETLRLCGAAAGMDHRQAASRTQELLALVGLDGVKQRIRGYSRGMKQRLGIAQALIHQPKLLLCDEPTSALDPVGRREILALLEQAREYATIVFSTHILTDVERICNRIGILDAGSLKLEGDLEEIKRRHAVNRVRLELLRPEQTPPLCAALAKTEAIEKAEQKENGLDLQLRDLQSGVQELLCYLAREQVAIRRFEVQEPTLEDAFLEVVTCGG